MKRRVEAGDVGYGGQQAAGGVEAVQGLRLVQRRQVDEVAQAPFHLVVDHHRGDEVHPAVHDPVPDRVHLRRHRGEAVVGGDQLTAYDEVDLQGAGPGVDDEDAHLRTARSSRRSPAGPGRPEVRVLVVNAGSSYLKVDLVVGGELVTAYDGLPPVAPEVDAVGH